MLYVLCLNIPMLPKNRFYLNNTYVYRQILYNMKLIKNILKYFNYREKKIRVFSNLYPNIEYFIQAKL